MRGVPTIIIAALLVTLACTLCPWGTRKEGEWRCQPLPDVFQKSDLIGTWQAEYGIGTDADTLILRQDGTYDQIYTCYVCEPSISFENLGNRWWVEHRASGGLYLHLEGMRRCDFTDELCLHESGGGGDKLYWDYCEDRVVRMPDEVVLMVIGVSKGKNDISRSIKLAHMPPSSDATPFYFIFQEE
jgi:hypothetical protein